MENETEEGLKRRAYSIGFKLKNSGLDEELIYVRLEKQGIPVELAKQVAKDMAIEQKKQIKRDEQPFYILGIVQIGIGVLAAIVSFIVVPEHIYLPISFILGGVSFAYYARRKMK